MGFEESYSSCQQQSRLNDQVCLIIIVYGGYNISDKSSKIFLCHNLSDRNVILGVGNIGNNRNGSLFTSLIRNNTKSINRLWSESIM